MSRFPNPGYPIAPRLLRPILSIGLPLSFVRLGDRFPLLADLDETIWTYVDQSVADIRANLVITRTGRMRSVPFWRVTYFPKLTQGLQLGDIQVERSTYECLRGAFNGELPEGLPSLAQYTLDHAVSTIPGFGIRPLVDLLDAVQLHEADNSMADDAGDRLDLAQLQRIIQSPRTWSHYSGKYLPHLPKTVRLEELQLSARAYSCVDIRARAKRQVSPEQAAAGAAGLAAVRQSKILHGEGGSSGVEATLG